MYHIGHLEGEIEMPIFMKYGSIKGWSTETNHVGWIPVNSIQYGPEGARGGTVTKITCARFSDGSSTDLWNAMMDGKVVDAVIELAKTGSATPFLKWILSQARITELHFSGSRDLPTEELTLNFDKAKYVYDKDAS